MLKGIYAPIPTPFEADGEINWKGLKANLKWWNQSSLDGLVVAGTNGEAVLLDEAEKVKAFSFTREHLSAEKKMIAGSGCESARATGRLNRAAAGSGCDAVLVLNPSYYKGSLSDDVLYNYYMHVAENSPLPVILYNMPRNTMVNLSAGLVCRLSEHPNIAGIKDSSGNIVQIEEMIKHCHPGFAIFAGSASFLLPSLVMGAAGGTLALANIMPDECVLLKTLYKENKLEEARKLQLDLLEINNAVTARWGVAGLKAALDLIGRCGGPPRLPLLSLGEQETNELKTIMTRCNLIKNKIEQ
jgi:4-hydroxy-2-oxoglutarate aldolase